jgi:thiosulfate/3-mercaptopyruvate sulfurtransferase
MSHRRCLRVAICGLALSACAQNPTKVNDNPARQIGAIGSQSFTITPETVVVDARSSFDYSTAHIPHSVQMNWSDFTEPEEAQRGIMQNDLYAAARRIARSGIAPQTHVVVVGNGKAGEGEEGRVAWMLAYLGVTDVQFCTLDYLKPRLTNYVETDPPKAVQIWKPDPIEGLNVSREELLFSINKLATHQPASYGGQSPTLYRIIDVRKASDYLGRSGMGLKKYIPNIDAINIPWGEFFDSNLRPKADMADRLRAVDIQPSYRIIVLDEDGIASAAVTLALHAMGFSNAGNYSGGLKDLMSAYPNGL